MTCVHKKRIEISNKDFTNMPKTNKQKRNANKRKAKVKPQFDKNKKTKSAQVSSEQPTIVAKDNGKNKKHVSVSSLEITGHGLRQISITTLVNDSAVNIEESLAFARHTSVAAQRPYMIRDAQSEMNRFKAQGLVSNLLDGGEK